MSDREVQLLDSEASRADWGRTRGSGLGSADRTGVVQIATRPLPPVLLRWQPAAPGGDGTKTQQVETSCRRVRDVLDTFLLYNPDLFVTWSQTIFLLTVSSETCIAALGTASGETACRWFRESKTTSNKTQNEDSTDNIQLFNFCQLTAQKHI